MRPRVQVEIGCRSLREPFSLSSISSLVDKQYSEHEFAQASIYLPTVNPERTLLEKIFLLHEEFQRPSQSLNPIPNEEIIDAWRADYKTMQEQMIYGDSPSFDKMISGIKDFVAEINKLNWKMESEF